jgi:hypothetical protein
VPVGPEQGEASVTVWPLVSAANAPEELVMNETVYLASEVLDEVGVGEMPTDTDDKAVSIV